ncbi:hypothetical protein [Sphingomonas sp. IC081]|uniref:hypothetical protein n=1 Tax=Sphingomonas sp. IC081 TaxID=304378 RepID=UPI00115B8CAC|nr:hypothetical protein [Sphingomonas sp. IC081]
MPAMRTAAAHKPLQNLAQNLAWLAFPLLAIALAKLAGHSEIAWRHPRIAALLFVWIAADTLVLSLMARSTDHHPSRQAVLARLAAAALVVLLGAPPAVRMGLGAMPAIWVALILTVLLHTGWSLLRAGQAWRGGAPGERWHRAAMQIVPEPLWRLAMAEVTVLRLALTGWRAKPDVPAAALPFAYHRHLAPMMGVLLALQAIEIGVMDVVLRLWSPRVANLLLELGIVALLYFVGLIRSLRLRPILLTADGLTVRSGVLAEQRIAFAEIAQLASEVTAAEVKAATTRNMALLAWPNVIVRLARPIARKPLLRERPPIRALAFRVDDPAAFHAALAARLSQETR